MTAFLLEGLFPPDVITAELAIADAAGQLFPEEQRAIAGAVQKRAREFLAGRSCARAALSELGWDACAIPQGPDRQPLWPAGVVGSLSHAAGRCAVAVARAEKARSIGLDIESDVPMREPIMDRITTPTERQWISVVSSERSYVAKLVFSAKECFYKLQHPLTKTYLGFGDVETDFDWTANRFALHLLRDVPRLDRRDFSGQFAIRNGFVATAMVLV